MTKSVNLLNESWQPGLRCFGVFEVCLYHKPCLTHMLGAVQLASLDFMLQHGALIRIHLRIARGL